MNRGMDFDSDSDSEQGTKSRQLICKLLINQKQISLSSGVSALIRIGKGLVREAEQLSGQV
jgi:hypothetical protein